MSTARAKLMLSKLQDIDEDEFTLYELEFMKSITTKVEAGQALSPKQTAVLEKIFEDR